MEPSLINKTERTVSQVITHLDKKVWDSIAVKAIQKITPHKLKQESVVMFTDFTGMNSIAKGTSKTVVQHIHQPITKLKENYILGVSKIVTNPIRTQSQRVLENQPKPLKQQLKRKYQKRVRTEASLSEKEVAPVKGINNFFRLTDFDKKNEEEEKIDQVYRSTKHSDELYARNIEQASRQLQAKRHHRTATETRKFKQLKAYTYDFQGKLMSKGQKQPTNSHKVVCMKPQFTQELVTNLVRPSRKTSDTKVSRIIENKKVIHHERQNFLELVKEKKQAEVEQEKAKRRASFVKNVSINKFENIFNKETRVQVGVSITDLDDRSRVTGSPRNKADIRNLKLDEFKDHSKQVFNSTRLKFKGNQKETFYKTQGDESISRDRMRIKTQGDDFSSKITSTYRKFRTGRGIIHIKHQQLYTENFSPERTQ